MCPCSDGYYLACTTTHLNVIADKSLLAYPDGSGLPEQENAPYKTSKYPGMMENVFIGCLKFPDLVRHKVKSNPSVGVNSAVCGLQLV